MSTMPVTEVESFQMIGQLQKQRPSARPKNWYDRLEAFVSSLSVRDNFWHRICSFIWFPFAFFSGIRMKRIDVDTFSAVLPFTRFGDTKVNGVIPIGPFGFKAGDEQAITFDHHLGVARFH